MILFSLIKNKAFYGWLLIALFFCYQYVLRVMPGVISQELRSNFHLTAEEFSSLGAYCLYAYSFLQIPMGFVVDRLGIKRTVLGSLLLCILGTAWLPYAGHLGYAQVSRILVGIGSACAFMSSLKWVADHFETGKQGFLMGATLTLGTIGALSAAHPFLNAVAFWGWKSAVLITCGVGAALWFCILLGLKEGEKEPTDRVTLPSSSFDINKLISDLKTIITTKRIVVYALLAVGVYTPLAVLADLWGVSFLVEKFALSRGEAAGTTMLMYVGLAVGSLVLPPLAERYKLTVRILQISTLGLLVLFSFVLLTKTISLVSLKTIFLTIGFLCGAEMMCFSGALIGIPSRISGLTLGFVNTVNMLVGALLQQIIGYILDFRWAGNLSPEGLRLYSPNDYNIALTLLPMVLLICAILSFSLKKDSSYFSKASEKSL